MTDSNKTEQKKVPGNQNQVVKCDSKYMARSMAQGEFNKRDDLGETVQMDSGTGRYRVSWIEGNNPYTIRFTFATEESGN